MRTILLAASLVALVGCGPTPAMTVGPTGFQGLPDPANLSDCDDAFRVWVDGAHALNEPDVDIFELMVDLEGIQRRVFELCTLAEAEQLNQEMPLEVAPGLSRPMIEPDFRTFAEVECVDESPLLDGTALCAEVLP